MEDKLVKEFVTQAMYRMDESTRMIGIAFNQLSEKDIWLKPNEASNSVGNLVLHLCGNITQYGIASLGGTKDFREREKEFLTNGGETKAELWDKLVETVGKSKRILNTISSEELLRSREVQGFSFSGIGVVLHVVEHYSYHTGQIAYWTKIIKNKDLGFYEGIDLEVKNK
ncbi:MAG: DUF1572 family protein [Bacteroidota bacterium]